MAQAVGRWSRAGLQVRLGLLVATSLAWTVISVEFVLLHPSYWDPVTLADWFAVWGYTTAWLLTAGAMLVVREVSPGDVLLRRTALLVAVACATTGIANALEDGFEIAGFGSVYVVGFFTTLIGLAFVAAMTWAGPDRRLTFVPVLGAVAIFTTVLGGGPIALVAWLGFAVLLARSRRTAPTGA